MSRLTYYPSVVSSRREKIEDGLKTAFVLFAALSLFMFGLVVGLEGGKAQAREELVCAYTVLPSSCMTAMSQGKTYQEAVIAGGGHV